MGFLKRLDLFRSINREQKDGTVFGALLTFATIILLIFFFSKELKLFNEEKVNTTLHLLNLKNAVIQVEFDITIFKVKCEHLLVSETHEYEEIRLEKYDFEETGCQLKGIYYMQPMDNEFTIKPDMASSIMDMMQGNNPDGRKYRIDFSHRINKLQFGRSSSGLTSLSLKYPDMVKVNPLSGHEFESKEEGDGHSVFLYELNIVGAKVNGVQEMIYHYNKNTINSNQIQPAITFLHDFSPIAVSYDEHTSRNVLEFVTYLFAILGGILAIIKFLHNLLMYCTSSKKGITIDSVMELG